jgi:L-threonylcarbamoyladenylate synthase
VRVIGEREWQAAVAELAAGGVVAVPTDTVYGLAACLTSVGVESLFSLKARSSELALPVLVGSIDQARAVAASWPACADRLARVFWPGALTVVVPAPPAVGSLVGGSGDSVGLRRPDCAVLDLLCAALGPLALTSANRHGAPAATTIDEVVASFELGAGPVLAIDGGRCDGVPSTVVDCTAEPVRRLRDGAVRWGDIAAVAAGRAPI